MEMLKKAGATRMDGDTKPVHLFGNSVRIPRIRELTGLMVRDAVTFDITIILLFENSHRVGMRKNFAADQKNKNEA